MHMKTSCVGKAGPSSAPRVASQFGQGPACFWLVRHGSSAHILTSQIRLMMIMLKRSLLGNDFTEPTFWMHSFRAEKVMMLSDPKHGDHIFPSLGMFPIVLL